MGDEAERSERRSRIEFGEIQNMAEQAYSRQWWSQERPKCDVFASVYTSAESEKGNSRMVDRRKRILEDIS